MEAVQNGKTDEERWRGLEALRPRLRRFLSQRCRDDNEADDIIQETFVRAARYRPSLTSRARLQSWVLRIAGNVFRDHVRRSYRQQSVGFEEEVLEGLEGSERGPGEGDDTLIEVEGELLDRETVLSYLATAFPSLMEHDRKVLGSFYGGDESCAVTAGDCGIAPSLVKVRLFRARRRLERAIQREFIRARTRRVPAL